LRLDDALTLGSYSLRHCSALLRRRELGTQGFKLTRQGVRRGVI
jgi:hypothetical protein